jgi:transcriptional regulator with XRE-family HTH domain
MNKAEQTGRDLELAIAGRIRKNRLAQGHTLERLAKITGLSKGYLSQIENHEKTPPIGTLTKIAYGLGLNVVDLISDEPPPKESRKFSLVRSRNRQSILHTEAAVGSIYDSFGFGRSDRFMDSYIVTISHEYPPKPLIHSGQEMAYTLEGEHEFYYNGQTYKLKPGDAVYFDSDLPHMSRSVGKKPAKVLVVFCNPGRLE